MFHKDVCTSHQIVISIAKSIQGKVEWNLRIVIVLSVSIDVFHVRSIPQLYTNDIYRRVDADYPRPTPRKYKQRVKWRLKLYRIIIMIIIIKQKRQIISKLPKLIKSNIFFIMTQALIVTYWWFLMTEISTTLYCFHLRNIH